MEKELGKRIKQLRTEQNLTLRELGERAQLSVGYISLVERGLSTISLTALQKLASALGVDSNEFFSLPTRPQSCVTRGYDLTPFQLEGSHFVYHSLMGNMPPEESAMEPVLVTVLPGQKREDVITNAHAGEEFGYVLEGTLTFFVGDTEYDLYPGDSLHISSQLPHNWANFTNKLVKMLYITTIKIFSQED